MSLERVTKPHKQVLNNSAFESLDDSYQYLRLHLASDNIYSSSVQA